MNNVSIIGRLGTDPEVRHTNNDKTVVSFQLAIDNPYRDANTPDWVAVEAWGKTAELIGKHKNKGDQVAITGRITSSSWEDKDGNKRSRVFVTAERVDFLHTLKTNKGEEAA